MDSSHNEYKKVNELWDDLTGYQKIQALERARIWYKGQDINNISFYTKKVALKAIGKIKE